MLLLCVTGYDSIRKTKGADVMPFTKPISENDNKEETYESMQRFMNDMQEVDKEMENGGRRYDEDALKEALGLN